MYPKTTSTATFRGSNSNASARNRRSLVSRMWVLHSRGWTGVLDLLVLVAVLAKHRTRHKVAIDANGSLAFLISTGWHVNDELLLMRMRIAVVVDAIVQH